MSRRPDILDATERLSRFTAHKDWGAQRIAHLQLLLDASARPLPALQTTTDVDSLLIGRTRLPLAGTVHSAANFSTPVLP